MKIIFNYLDKLMQKYNRLAEKKEFNIILGYCLILGFILFVLLVPFLIASFYNVISHGDDFGHTANVHLAWKNNIGILGFFAAVRAALQNMIAVYRSWGGNYTSFFFSALQPIAFSQRLNFVGTFVFLGCFMIAQYRFFQELLCEQFKLSKGIERLSYIAIMILETQWLTSARQAFFWYSGCVTNTLGFAGGLAILRILLKAVREKKLSNKTFIWGMVLAIFVGGCNYSSMMSLFIIIVLFCLDLIFQSKLEKKLKVKLYTIIAILFIGSIISIIAPGNAVRQLYNDGTGAVHAIWLAIVYGKETFFQYFDYKTLLLSLLLFPFIWNEISEEKDYKFPLLVILISCGVFCAAFTPTAKSDMSVGNRRTRNLYWWIYLNLYLFNFTYIIGWFKSKLTRLCNDRDLTFKQRHYIAFLIVICFVGMITVKKDDLKKMPSVITGFEITSGKYAEFGRKMEKRNELYESDEKSIVVEKVDYMPYVILEDKGLFANEVGETYTSVYYQKDEILVVE